jgi:hypothetical protein
MDWLACLSNDLDSSGIEFECIQTVSRCPSFDLLFYTPKMRVMTNHLMCLCLCFAPFLFGQSG